MRIAMLSPLTEPTLPDHDEPIRRMVASLVNGLSARGIDVTLFPADREGSAASPQGSATQPWCDPSTGTREDTLLYLGMSDLFEHAEDFDLIHNHAGLRALTYANLVKRPMLTTLHECQFRVDVRALRKYNGRTYYVAVSDAFQPPNIAYQATIRYGIDVDSLVLSERPSSYLLFCGILRPENGVVEAMEISRLTGKPLVIAGVIQDEPFFSREIAPHLDGNVMRYIGRLLPEMRNDIFGGALALLDTGTREGPHDVTVQEANACGTPVVSFSRSRAEELIAQGINGFAVSDVSGAAQAVNGIHAVSRAGCRKLAQERFSHQHMVDQYLRVYEAILEKAKTEDRRPWGYYVVLSDLPDHKVKRIVVWPGKRLSLQRHRLRSEHWMIVAGSPVVTLNEQEISMSVGQSIDIPMGAKHRIANPGTDPVVFIEVQMGEYFGEDDIERFQDDFGRF